MFKGPCGGHKDLLVDFDQRKTKMWIDLIKTGADKDKSNEKSTKILLELWQLLKPEQ